MPAVGADLDCIMDSFNRRKTELMHERKTDPAAAALEPSDDEVNLALDELDVSRESNLIGVLQEVQERFGYLPANALKEISRRTRIRLAKIHGVVSFYAQFYTKPRGKHTIRACRGTACHVKGANRVIGAIEKTLGIKEGETTPDMLFCFETVACLGACFLAPAMMIDNRYFGRLTPQRVVSVIKSYRVKEYEPVEID